MEQIEGQENGVKGGSGTSNCAANGTTSSAASCADFRPERFDAGPTPGFGRLRQRRREEGEEVRRREGAGAPRRERRLEAARREVRHQLPDLVADAEGTASREREHGAAEGGACDAHGLEAASVALEEFHELDHLS